MTRYSTDRSNLFNEFGGSVAGGVATTSLDAKQQSLFEPRFLEIESLIRALIPRIATDFQQAGEVIVRLEAAGKRAFGNEFGTYGSKYPELLPLPSILGPASPAAKKPRRRKQTLVGLIVRRSRISFFRAEFKVLARLRNLTGTRNL